MRNRTISRTTRFPVVFTALSSMQAGKAGRRLMRDIFYWFFYLQFETRHRPKKRPVVNVDHPLDEAVPFRPGDVKKYMFFIPLWMKSISFYIKSFGRKSIPRVCEFLDELRLLYCNAGKVYQRCSSTTRRPGPRVHPIFLVIHITDPHLHCIPSLHVAVVIFNFLKMRDLLTDAASRTDEFKDEIEYCRREAVAIIDTILTVKQHSINCVAAGLYFIHSYHSQFSRDECREICRSLLSTVDENIAEKEAIRDYTLNLFNSFCEKHDSMKDTDPREIVIDFLTGYETGIPEKGGAVSG